MKRFLTHLFLALALGVISVGCMEFNVDEELFVCRAPGDCGEGFSCISGAKNSNQQCVCVCLP
ncbi:MAG TPA: hypothetical protein EYN06_01765, partial [Myxococcales bacterium]|nr:hypothetical protein [Myxococcales bacterium]